MKQSTERLEWLNYHHLRHFWVIARYRSITRAAVELSISQSTLSEQLSELEEWLGQKLFERKGRSLELTEAGSVALEYAESIFETGQELLNRFRGRSLASEFTLRIGAVGPLSKNVQYDFIEPLLGKEGAHVQVAAGSLSDLIQQLREHQLDLVLSNTPLRADQEPNIFNHLLGEMPVYLAGTARSARLRGHLPRSLKGVPLFLPSRESHVRADFDLLLANAGVEPEIRAEVDDMALLRLLALSGKGLALVPAIVVERELLAGKLRHLYRIPRIAERFYAITMKRRFGAGRITEIIEQFQRRLKDLRAFESRGQSEVS